MINRLTTLLTLLALLSGCVTETVKTTAVPTLSTYEKSLPSDEVLDIAVVFDPGIAEADPAEGIYPEIRRAEATFMARELALVLDDQGVWGASRVVPPRAHHRCPGRGGNRAIGWRGTRPSDHGSRCSGTHLAR